MNYIGTTSDETEIYMGDDVILIKAKNGMMQRITPDDMYIIDKYGNEMSMKELKMCFEPHAPTYDELYEHWLKTK